MLDEKDEVIFTNDGRIQRDYFNKEKDLFDIVQLEVKDG